MALEIVHPTSCPLQIKKKKKTLGTELLLTSPITLFLRSKIHPRITLLIPGTVFSEPYKYVASLTKRFGVVVFILTW